LYKKNHTCNGHIGGIYKLVGPQLPFLLGEDVLGKEIKLSGEKGISSSYFRPLL
jgi:hypothetical protein